jgi:hypothetical protein
MSTCSLDKVQPIRPEDVSKYKLANDLIPNQVIEAFNICIARNFNGGSSEFTKEEVVNEIIRQLDPGCLCGHDEKEKQRQQAQHRINIYRNGWLNVEEIYSDYGWNVTYYKPVYTSETYAATYTFFRRDTK